MADQQEVEMEKTFNLVFRLRERARIRRLATCRGPEDRLANDLDEAANELERLYAVMRNI